MKRILVVLLALLLLLPSVGMAAGRNFGPRLNDSAVPAAGEDIAWRLLDEAVVAADPQEGIELVLKASAAAPENGEVQLNCAYVLLMLDEGNKQLKVTEGLLRQAVELLTGPDRISALQVLAEVLVITDQIDEAIKLVEEAIAGIPANDDLKLLLANVLYYANRNADALSTLEELAEDSPENMDALRLRATILLADCRWDEALEAYKQIEQRWPEYLEGTYGQYMTYVASGQFDRGLRLMDQMILYSKDNSLWVERARLRLWTMFDPEAALSETEALLRSDPNWIDVLVVKMSAHLMLFQYDTALETAEQITALDEDYGALMVAIVAMNEGRWGDARDTLESLAERSPDWFVHWQYLSVALSDGFDDLEGAQEAMARAFTCAGAYEDYDLFTQLGHFYRESGDLLEAARAFAEADRLVNDDPMPLFYLAMTCMEAGRKQDVQDVLEEMERRYPGWYYTMLCRVLVDDAQNLPDQAVAAFEAYAEKFPYFAQGALNLQGMLRATAGQPEGAEMIKTWIDEQEAVVAGDWEAYAVALIQLGHYEEAEKALDEAVSLIMAEPQDAGYVRDMWASLYTTFAELALAKGDMEACVEAFTTAVDYGWLPSSLAVYARFSEVYESKAFKALLDEQTAQTQDWDLSVLPVIPE